VGELVDLSWHEESVPKDLLLSISEVRPQLPQICHRQFANARFDKNMFSVKPLPRHKFAQWRAGRGRRAQKERLTFGF
jgi:hypothetical protein